MLGAGAVSRPMNPNALRKIVPPIHHRDTGAQRNIEKKNRLRLMVVKRRASSPSCSQFRLNPDLSITSVGIKFQEDLKDCGASIAATGFE